MIEIGITEDIRKYKPTLFGPFTQRQALCIAGGVATVGILYKIISAHVENPADGPWMLIMAAPSILFACIGWLNFFGMPFEIFFLYMTTILTQTNGYMQLIIF